MKWRTLQCGEYGGTMHDANGTKEKLVLVEGIKLVVVQL